ncbi:hypothetical protein F2Q68_00038648 [Brassica cretica]|uniref:Uncharacterized protein n=1 Tax=Brassica cretica TaxID=69181 RepID=A0A8S9M9P5_BRACR|nr:hypothetical protein F2Q68_00038648 [Brassica cretica]
MKRQSFVSLSPLVKLSELDGSVTTSSTSPNTSNREELSNAQGLDDVVKGSTTKVSQILVLVMIDGGDSIIGVVMGVDCEYTNMGKVVKEFDLAKQWSSPALK